MGRGGKGEGRQKSAAAGHLMRNVFALFAHTGSKQTAISVEALRKASLFPAAEAEAGPKGRGRESKRARAA